MQKEPSSRDDYSSNAQQPKKPLNLPSLGSRSKSVQYEEHLISHNLFKKTNDAGIIPLGSKGGLLESFKKKQNEDISGFDEDMMLPSMFQKSNNTKTDTQRGYYNFKMDGLQSIPGINIDFDRNL